MDMRIWCKLCGRKELVGDHALEKVEPREWLRGFTGPRQPTAVLEREKARTKVRTRAKSPDIIPDTEPEIPDVLGVGEKSPDTPLCARLECWGHVPRPKRGALPEFCSESCRKKVSRGAQRREPVEASREAK